MYSTYLGSAPSFGTGGDSARAIVIDAVGNAYVAGMSASSFPLRDSLQGWTGCATCSTFSPTVPADAFVSKLNPDGTTLIFSTLFGGHGDDTAASIARDAAGHLYIAGTTTAFGQAPGNNFPVTNGALQTSFAGPATGGGDGFIAKFGPGFVPLDLPPASVVNAAGFQPSAGISPGALASIFGSNLSVGTATREVVVTFNGVVAPLLYVSAQQINAQVPFEVPAGPLTVQVNVAALPVKRGLSMARPSHPESSPSTARETALPPRCMLTARSSRTSIPRARGKRSRFFALAWVQSIRPYRPAFARRLSRSHTPLLFRRWGSMDCGRRSASPASRLVSLDCGR